MALLVIIVSSVGYFGVQQIFEEFDPFSCKFKETDIDLYIPKFEQTCQDEYVPHFQSLGISEVSTPKANLENMTEANDLYVSHIIHVAKIIVDEDGTEAAAITVVSMDRCASKMKNTTPTIFRADRTFMYYLVYEPENLTLFTGVFNG